MISYLITKRSVLHAVRIFFFNDTATTEIYTLSLHDALPISDVEYQKMRDAAIAIIREIGVEAGGCNVQFAVNPQNGEMLRSEEHTSELQSRQYLVCRLLLEKKQTITTYIYHLCRRSIISHFA